MMDSASLVGKVVTLKEEIEECEGYLEAGMRARIAGIRTSHDGVFVFTFDCTEFEEVNRPFESANYYDDRGVARLTAREAGKYEPRGDYYLPGPGGWPGYFDLQPGSPALARVMAAFEARADRAQGYVAWLEAELSRAIEAGHELPSTPDAGPGEEGMTA